MYCTILAKCGRCGCEKQSKDIEDVRNNVKLQREREDGEYGEKEKVKISNIQGLYGCRVPCRKHTDFTKIT